MKKQKPGVTLELQHHIIDCSHFGKKCNVIGKCDMELNYLLDENRQLKQEIKILKQAALILGRKH
jgi:hypothetical protein